MINKKLRKRTREIMRKPLVKKYQKEISNKGFTIFANNCIAGVIYHELDMRFDSPTINLYMTAEDYIKFLEDPKYYLNQEIKEVIDKERKYPVGKIDDIKLYFVHYPNFYQAYNAWNRRKERINWENLYIMFVERDGCTEEIVQRFLALPYKNKVIFTHKCRKEEETYYIKGSETTEIYKNKKRPCVRNLLDYIHKFSGKRYLDKFDIIAFLNRT